MKLERAALVERLNIAAPALAQKDLVEELSHFWFDGVRVYAYNDVIGIQAPFKSEFIGGLRGALLLGLLEKTKAKEVTIADGETEAEIMVKAGAARLRLTRLAVKRSVWQFPAVKEEACCTFNAEFLQAIKRCMFSIGDDTSTPDQLGVTIVMEDDMLNFYSTDSKTMTWVMAAKPKGWKAKRVTLPKPFCEQLLRLCKEGGQLAVFSDAVVAFVDRKVQIWSRVVDVERPIEFDRVFTEKLPKSYTKDAIPIPSRLRLALERVAVVMDGHGGEPIELSLDAEFLRIKAQPGTIGELKDNLRLDDAHKEVSARIDPALIRRAYDYCDGMLLTDSVLIMTGEGGFIHLISTMQS